MIASWARAAAAHARGDLHGSVWADLEETSHLPHLATRERDAAARTGLQRASHRGVGLFDRVERGVGVRGHGDAAAAQGFRDCGQPLDQARCEHLAK